MTDMPPQPIGLPSRFAAQRQDWDPPTPELLVGPDKRFAPSGMKIVKIVRNELLDA